MAPSHSSKKKILYVSIYYLLILLSLKFFFYHHQQTWNWIRYLCVQVASSHWQKVFHFLWLMYAIDPIFSRKRSASISFCASDEEDRDRDVLPAGIQVVTPPLVSPSKRRWVLVISLYFLCIQYFFLQLLTNREGLVYDPWRTRQCWWHLWVRSSKVCAFIYLYGFKLMLYLSRDVPAETRYYRSTGEYVSRPTTSLRRVVVKTEPVDTDEEIRSPPNLRAETKSEIHPSSPIVIASSESDDLTLKAKPAKKKAGLPSFGNWESGCRLDNLSERIPVTPCKGKEPAVDAQKHVVGSPTASMPPCSPRPSEKVESIYLEDM